MPYSKEKLSSAVKHNVSIRGVLIELGRVPAGGNYQSIKNAIAKYGIDTSHFLGQAHWKGKTYDYRKRPLKSILVIGRVEQSFKLKNRLLSEGLKQWKCENCKSEQWMNSKIPLELHHLDGDKTNNGIDNLELLCPNCHALTGNYRGKNKRRRD